MLIVGLGNPGKKYEKSYHNIGFKAVDDLASRLGMKFNKKANQAEIAEGYMNGEKLVIAKPQTYMNLSGESVKMLMGAYGFSANEVLVFFDDIELPLGMIRVRKDGSAGTHNGMKNIINECKTKEIPRIRIGLGDDRNNMDLADYVLSNIPSEKWDVLNKVFDKIMPNVEEYIKNQNIDKLMQTCNGMMN